jgi:hypothetical protein
MHRTLSKYLGYDSFRPLQEDIIKDVLAGKDVFCSDANGWRKIAVLSDTGTSYGWCNSSGITPHFSN